MTIQPSQHNPPFQDVAAGLSMAVVRDGRAPMTGPLNMNGFKVTGLQPGTASSDAASMENISDLAVAIGDGAWSLRDLSPNWLRRNGGIYEIAAYPVLAALLPPLPDGVTWSASSPSIGDSFISVCKGNGRWVAVGENGTIYISDNRTSWRPVDSKTSAALVSVAFGNGLFVAISLNGIVCVSANGEDWETNSVTAFGSQPKITFGNGLFVIAGSFAPSQPVILTSQDGETWSTNKLGAFNNQLMRAASWNGSMFIACGNGFTETMRCFRSPDGDSWTSADTGLSPAIMAIDNDGSKFVLVGNGGVILSTVDGLFFEEEDSFTVGNLRDIAYSPALGWMAVGVGGVAGISADGVSWSGVTPGTSADLLGIANDPAQPQSYVCVGGAGTIITATRTTSAQFQVPNDDPTYGWIRAV